MSNRRCTTHHHACDCREAEFAAVKAERDALYDAIFQISIRLCGMRESDMDAMSWHTQLIARTQYLANLEKRAGTIVRLTASRNELRQRIARAPKVKVRGKVGEIATIAVSHDLVGKRVALVVLEDGE